VLLKNSSSRKEKMEKKRSEAIEVQKEKGKNAGLKHHSQY
jgi:hypothetical protein